MQEKLELSVERTDEEKTSLKELILTIRDWVKYLLSKWYIILLFGLIGAALGFGYALTKKPVYTATTSFVLETGGRSGGLGAYAGLAASFGIDLGGSGGGLFEGENILELYRSRKMITKTLLSEGEFDGKRQLLIDWYVTTNGLKEGWEKSPLFKNIQFRSDNIYPSAQQQLLHDSVMGQIVKMISQGNLKVEKKDKKLNIIYVAVSGGDELFVKAFNQRLVENVNRFYLETKSKKNLENVNILQAKADSVRRSMTGSISQAAAIADATPNQNPTRMAQRVAPIQNARVNSEINQEVLGSLLQNLEMSKIALSKETPLIQIVDEPILPLDKTGLGKFKGLILGAILGVIIIVLVLVARRVIKTAMS
ncbi:lipopolysaccharide biosynthesis protein [Niabella sp. CJ426]|uniref:lipopolysaccharide biosynthesis protein n=1 Tax=Niabella sp. CJ426 TaxID=3393740 RepID=UPI003D009F50